MLEPKSRYRSFGGWVEFHEHPSEVCHATMRFSIFLPGQVQYGPVPVLYWLSGLTCSEENFTIKSGAQRYAAEHGIALVAPDTSPRNTGIQGEAADWEVGAGAGFYVDATTPRWASHFKMYSYVTDELPRFVRTNFPVDAHRESISGHSMGGHGALVAALRQPGRYRSVSAFSPISAPALCPWGRKGFLEFLGSDESAWKSYDAHLLVATSKEKQPLLVDQGADDKFLKEQLMPDKLEAACLAAGVPISLRTHAGYDHSYYFVASFIGEHIEYHAKALKTP